VSGTGPTPAEQHLGDRLAALVDGELKHDTRERVLAHLATCGRCKAEAAAQRRLKNVFAQSAPPSPSEGFLARLQGLPGDTGGDADGGPGPFGGSGRFTEGVFPVVQPPRGRPARDAKPGLGGFGYLPAPHGSTGVLPGGSTRSGFRIHETGREQDRPSSRGRRFAFAAAGAVSLAAIALGGALQTNAGTNAPARAAGAGNTVTPLETARGENGGPASRRGQSGNGTPVARGAYGYSAAPVGPPSAPGTTSAAPYVAPAFSTGGLVGFSDSSVLSRHPGNPLAVPVLPQMSPPPLIRPTGTTPLFARVLGRFAAPAPGSPVPSEQPSSAPPSASPLLTPPADRVPSLSSQP